MRRIGIPLLCLTAGVLLVPATPPAFSQKPKATSTPVEIVTADQVLLKGHFYPSTKGESAPTVLLLHALHEDSNKSEWLSLAASLQAKGYAVLRFDFRGHGDSTSVRVGKPNAINPALSQRGFWDYQENAYGVRASKTRKDSIEAKQFTPDYTRILANDITAAKAWLDASGKCDTSNLVLIGAKEGATLGALWLNADWNCYRLVQNPNFPMGPKVPDLENPEGQNVRAAVWLSISPTLGNRTVNLPAMLYTAATEKKTPMLFFYGDSDAKGKRASVACEKVLKKDKKSLPLTAAVKIPTGGVKLDGSSLLAPALKAQGPIIAWMGNALQANKAAAAGGSPRNPQSDVLVYQARGFGQPQPARVEGKLLFYNFAPFLR